MADSPQSRLLAIPAEIREEIYRLILHPDANRKYHEDEYTSYSYQDALVLFKINKQIYLESRKIFRDLNIFVRVETPFPEAHRHVAHEGHVPMIAMHEKATNFTDHVMSVCIDAPEMPMIDGDEQRFVILLGDLDKFTTTWFYSNLSHPGLNMALRLTLRLRDPFTPSYEEKRLPKALQQKLLLPFGTVKDLRCMAVTGDPKPLPSIETELRELQAIPNKSPEHCLRETLRLKLEGNNELAAGRYDAALQTYKQAWLAMHVVVKGRKRHIHADHFFNRELREDPFRGKHGQSERLVLRVQLVANTCLVYLKLEDYVECAFWGMRTINMLRAAMGADERRDIPPEDEAVLGFPGADQMGKIYYRTALAKKELDEKGEARKLLRVAAIYLPHDKMVRKEIAACALRLG